MATFVLVHGAWHGGWCYRDTARELRAAGHLVFTPTHTGVGERAHLAADTVSLDTHIDDVCGTIECEELTDVILCGHSYGGMVITGVADRLPDRIKSLVYLDGYVPADGESLHDLIQVALGPELGAQFVATFRSSAAESGRGQMAALAAEGFNVVPWHRDWVNRQTSPQSLATFEAPIRLSGAVDSIEEKLFILADGWDPNPFRYFAKLLAARPGWRVLTWPAGHDIMVDMPVELAKELLTMAGRPRDVAPSESEAYNVPFTAAALSDSYVPSGLGRPAVN